MHFSPEWGGLFKPPYLPDHSLLCTLAALLCCLLLTLLTALLLFAAVLLSFAIPPPPLCGHSFPKQLFGRSFSYYKYIDAYWE